MRVGIKYCGGCNPTYRREDIEDAIAGVVGREKLVYTASCDGVDVLVVICGCKTACAARDVRCENLVVVSEPKTREEVMKLLGLVK